MATIPIAPRADNEGSIGKNTRRWAAGYFYDLYAYGNFTNGVSSVSMNSALSILTGLDGLSASEGTQLKNIDSTTISIAQWAYLGAMDQGLATTDSVAFANVTANVTGNLTGTILTANQPNIDHDLLANFVADEHIDHTTVSIIAGTGLSGGGTIAASRTLNVTGLTVTEFASPNISQWTNDSGYLTSYTETQTLDDVTTLGNSTANTIIVGKLESDTVQVTGGTGTQGTMTWNVGEETVELITNGAITYIGQETHFHVRNTSGAILTKGTVVRATGTVGGSGKITVGKMIADGSIDSIYVVGIVDVDIANNADGKIQVIGKISNMNTSAWADGTVLWADPAVPGGLTSTKPTAPNLKLPVAFVIYQHVSNGIIQVRIDPGTDINNDHGAEITSVADTDLWHYNLANLRWENFSIDDLTEDATPDTANDVVMTFDADAGIHKKVKLENLTAASAGSLTENITVGENVVSGDLLYLNTDGKYWKADYNAEATASTELRIATDTILADATGPSLIYGSYTTTGLTAGTLYYIGLSGGITTTQPTGNGDIVRIIGTALSTTELVFSPDETFIELSTASSTPSQPGYREVTSTTTFLPADYTINCTSGTFTVNLPTAVGIQGKIYNLKNSGTGTITLDGNGSETIDGVTTITIEADEAYTVQSTGANWIII